MSAEFQLILILSGLDLTGTGWSKQPCKAPSNHSNGCWQNFKGLMLYLMWTTTGAMNNDVVSRE